MSTNDQASKNILARWRRAGHGIWMLTFVVEGYDDEFIQVVPGRVDQRKASKIACQNLAFELQVKKHFIILKSIVKEG